jgi:hypothetical protein
MTAISRHNTESQMVTIMTVTMRYLGRVFKTIGIKLSSINLDLKGLEGKKLVRLQNWWIEGRRW